MAFDFTTQTFEQVQRLVFPLVETLFGVDVDGFVGESSELFQEVGEGLDQIAGLFFLAAQALEDGILTAEELDGIIANAKELPQAIAEISDAFERLTGGDEEEPVG